jgi:CheY-like chemotaxis protein
MALGEDKSRHFIAVLAHELRNPIAPIRSGLDLIATGRLDEEARRDTVEMMRRQVSHLVRLVDDLLDVVRLDTGRLQIRRQPVLLREVVRSAIESIRPALFSKNQALNLDDAAADVIVDADPVRLAQAFVNILSANVKHTPVGGVVSVSVVERPGGLSILFKDQGATVTAGDLDRSFELFPPPADPGSDDGLGIGLALVKGLVELNEGTVEVRPRRGGSGTVFTVHLPLSLLEAAEAEAGTREVATEWRSHRVLIVDDNTDAAESLGLLFELDGHTIRLAHDGPTAVSEASEFQPEVILMDVGLPGFSGTEAARRIRSRETAVRPFIIALTGWGATEDREATRQAGCDLHLTKPIVHEELRRILLDLTAAREQPHGA